MSSAPGQPEEARMVLSHSGDLTLFFHAKEDVLSAILTLNFESLGKEKKNL